ncbi:hypothetical protein [Cupriavidus pauculus]|uniref:hypothetical protein n=1 Tax=Cupriavidus pauculus TaxID=82633 RepID=UPI001EE1EAB4|nr:hypothetical protein [Cupriavidus pauculus]GJG92843.1 hypothetical protein CBA19C6_00160 [Cupriavidus pauculus]
MKLTKMASAMPFAHFLGLAPGATSARAEDDDDDERKQREGESDEDYAKRMDELDDKEEKDKESKSSKAEGDDPDDKDAEDEDLEDGDDEDNKDDKETGKRAGRAMGARQRERARCAAIVAAGIKAGAVNQACVFAFDTSMTSKQAIAALGASALDKPKGRSGLADRMASVKVKTVTPQGEALPVSDAKAIADRAIAAAARARGEA